MNQRAALLLIPVVLFGQSATSPTFDVASVKPTAPAGPADTEGKATTRRAAGGRRSGGPGTDDPGRIHYPHMTLKSMLVQAYAVAGFQIRGPGWLDEERFDIEATLPPETTKAQFSLMLQNLIAERFKMSIRRETLEISGYAIVLARNGPKLRKSTEAATLHYDAPERRAETVDRFGLPTVSPNAIEGHPAMTFWNGPGGIRLYAEQQTIHALATELQNRLQLPVADATGLPAKYDFSLTFTPIGNGRPAPPDTELAPDIFAAVQSQLGLKLEPRKLLAELIVINHIEKVPTGN